MQFCMLQVQSFIVCRWFYLMLKDHIGLSVFLMLYVLSSGIPYIIMYNIPPNKVKVILIMCSMLIFSAILKIEWKVVLWLFPERWCVQHMVSKGEDTILLSFLIVGQLSFCRLLPFLCSYVLNKASPRIKCTPIMASCTIKIQRVKSLKYKRNVSWS